MAQPGRPLTELRGRTDEANDLALWLRRITSKSTVRALAKDFPYSATSWGEFRNGSKLLPEKLLIDVVARLVPEDMHARQRAEGLRLLHAAQEAKRRLDAGSLSRPVPEVKTRPVLPEGVAGVLLRLDDARLQQIEALRKLADSQQRCAQLENMVSLLQAQCAQLTQERDHARLEAQDAARLQSALEHSEANRVQAEAHLKHARRANEQAFELRLAAEANVIKAQAEVRRTTGADAGPGRLLPQQQPAGAGLDLPPLEQITEVLQAVHEQLTEQDEELDELRSHLGVAEAPAAGITAAPHVITGQVVERPESAAADNTVVREDSADNANNAVTSADTSLPGEEDSLVPLLSAVLSPDFFGRAIFLLQQRSGLQRWPLSRMAEEASFALPEGAARYTADSIQGWLEGSRFPRQVRAMRAMVEAMGATTQESTAFRAAYRRVAEAEARAFKNAYPRIRRQGDETFKHASVRTAQERTEEANRELGAEQEREKRGAWEEWEAAADRRRTAQEQAARDRESLVQEVRGAEAARDRESLAREAGVREALERKEEADTVGSREGEGREPQDAVAGTKAKQNPEAVNPLSSTSIKFSLVQSCTALATGTAWAVFAAGLKADPGPAVVPLIASAFVAALLSVLGWLLSRMILKTAVDRFELRLGTFMQGVGVVAGLVSPWLPAWQEWGRGPAELFGLL
ncbi:hypothetical protein [Streptomyces sp. S1]|uniref:hypothetical protein n=1 Tax=Streptomyces sp. S1 TaxID=718288 RepID=UPI0013CEC210|nr:hypothetical protein [Streptomyces sp. S1]